MKLRHCLAALAVALLLPNVRASAQTASSEPADEATETTKTTSTASAPATYVGFAPPPGPLRMENASGSSIQFGMLLQPQFEMAGAPDADLNTKNLFLRRIRLMVGGTLFKHFEYFFDTDYPDLFKVDPANQSGGTGKNAPGMNVQDAYVTYKPIGSLFKVDAGFMLPPLSHNAVQGAGTLYSGDYFVNSFRRNVISTVDPFGSSGQSPAGRDLGVQVRGLILNEHVDYRVGLFQGLRVGPVPTMNGMNGQVAGINFFRVAARVQINVLDAEPGFFYQGTYLGAKKILSVGAFYDVQDKYYSRGADLILDLPAGPGVLTAQGNFVQWSGGGPTGFIPTLPKSTAIMGEIGYLIRPLMISPIARFERLTVAADERSAVSPNEDRYGGGLAFWPYGHNSNLKAFFAKVHRDPAMHDFNQINVQWQVYFY